MADLGTAYVRIVPAAQGISGQITKILSPEATTAGTKAGDKISGAIGPRLQKVGRAFQTVGSTLTKYVTKPAMAAGAALGGVALVKGWSRMTEIDSARVKLQAIGNSAQDVEKITNNSLESVSGTAYGLNEAMTTAASAVAAGIKPGKELEKYLTAIADSAAVAGTDMSSMGNIINKVATQGKASNEILQQMAEAGIPIYQYLADQMGVTAKEVFDMASKGEIGLSDFQAAVTEHIGGAAKEIGSKTIKGAIANLGASISRVGANFLGSADDADSFAGRILPFLQNLTKKLGGVEEAAKEWGKKFADAIIKVVNFIRKIPVPVLKAIVITLIGLGPAISIITKVATAISMVRKAVSMLSGVFSLLTNPIGLIIAAIAALVIGFMVLWKKSKAFRQFWIKLWQGIKAVVHAVITVVVGYFKFWYNTLKKVWSGATKFFSKIWRGIKSVFSNVGKFFHDKFTKAANAVKNAFRGIGRFFSSLWNGVKQTASNIWNGIKNAILAPIRAIKNAIQGIVDKLKEFFSYNGKKVKLPNIKGKTPSLKWMAKGGIVNSPSIVGVGEAGPEAIIPLGELRGMLGSSGKGAVITNNITVNGAEKPEEYAARLVRQLKVEMRTI